MKKFFYITLNSICINGSSCEFSGDFCKLKKGKRTLAQKRFQITWDNGNLIYDPISGTIQNVVAEKVHKIYKNLHSRFPDSSSAPSRLLHEKFQPFCLTIYPNNECNLTCKYCYTPNKRNLLSDEINLSAIQAAAEIVADNCVAQKMPFILGFHGGNEPLLVSDRFNHVIEICQEITDRFGLELVSCCTTNGVISKDRATWAAHTFYGITLSWDGPPDVHDRFRLQTDGSTTSSIVQQSAEIFLDSSYGLKKFRIRSTVTSESVSRLLEIAQFFYQHNVKWIEFYPVFQNVANSVPEKLIPKASDFVKNFLLAKKWGEQYNMTIGYAGSRLIDFHDKYCPVYQNNLTVTPDGYLTACFLVTHNYKHQNNQYMYGRYDHKSDVFSIDWYKLGKIFNQLTQSYPQCENCFNYWHCAKGCPTVCPLSTNSKSFYHHDCTMEKWIGMANILETAGYEFSENELENCDSFFSNIVVDIITERTTYVQV